MVKLLYLGAEWCGPCKKMKPILDEFENDHKDILVVRIDVDEEIEMASDLQISSIPTLIVMKDNLEIARKRGALSKQGLKALVFGQQND